MKSLELNRVYYRDCVSKILHKHCPDIAGRHAAALIGYGSEVLGNDDEFSKRYGWGPRLLLFLAKKDHQSKGYTLLKILQKHVPLEFLGYPTRYTEDGPPQPTKYPGAPVGIAVTTCECFLKMNTGISRTDFPENPLSSKEWLLINEAQLLRLVSGEVYHDSPGTLTRLREYFHYFPEDVRRHKLAYQWTKLSTFIFHLRIMYAIKPNQVTTLNYGRLNCRYLLDKLTTLLLFRFPGLELFPNPP